jgi:hypothetical protein
MNIEEEDDDLEEIKAADDLLGSLMYGIRKIHMAGSWTEIVIGVVLEEIEDSFLIGMPVKGSEEWEGDTLTIKLTPVGTSPFERFFKSDIRLISFGEESLTVKYTEYLEDKSAEVFPDILKLIGSTTDRYSDYGSEDFGEEDEMEGSEKIEASEEVSEKGAVLVNNAKLSASELKEKVETALLEGRFLPSTSGKLPN